MRRLALAFTLAAWATGPAAAQSSVSSAAGVSSRSCAPEQLFHATIRAVTPGLAAANRAAQPRQLWRQGSRFLRSEEQPDPVLGAQALTIIAEPDIWLIDLATKTGEHSVDPGPDLSVHAPILPISPGLPPALRELEYGCEAEFVARHAPQPQKAVRWGLVDATMHSATFGDHMVAILMDQALGHPIMISYLRERQPVFVIRYDLYERGLPPRPDLFKPSRSIKMREAPVAQTPPDPAPPAPGEPTPG